MRRLRSLRQAAGISQTELARRARCGANLICGIEMNRLSPPTTSPTLRRLARALGYAGPAGELLDEIEADAERSD